MDWVDRESAGRVGSEGGKGGVGLEVMAGCGLDGTVGDAGRGMRFGGITIAEGGGDGCLVSSGGVRGATDDDGGDGEWSLRWATRWSFEPFSLFVTGKVDISLFVVLER